MARTPVGQHRPTRDDRAKNKMIAELNRECASLRRQLARSERENQRLQEQISNFKAEEVEPAREDAKPEVKAQGCLNCNGTEFSVFTTPSGTQFRTCQTCSHRERINAPTNSI